MQERGCIFFFYRPKVSKEEAHGPDDVQRLYIVLRPESGERTVEEKQAPDSGKEGEKKDEKKEKSNKGGKKDEMKEKPKRRRKKKNSDNEEEHPGVEGGHGREVLRVQFALSIYTSHAVVTTY